MAQNNIDRLKISIVGSGNVGKTTFIMTYLKKDTSFETAPTVYDNFMYYHEFDGRKIQVNIWDTAGQDTFQDFRTLAYSNCDILFLFLSVTDKSTGKKLVPFAEEFVKFVTPDRTPPMMVVVANKTDLREPSNHQHATTQEVKELAKSLSKLMRKNHTHILDNKVFWYETSCINNPDGVSAILQEVVTTYMSGGKQRKGGCSSH